MKNLFLMGGPITMSILSLLFVVMIAWIVYHLIVAMNTMHENREKALRKIEYGKSIGLFAMVMGIFAQLLGFFQAFTAIEKAGDISPAMIYGGLKVSMISTLYGILIYLISIALWFVATCIIERKKEKH